MSNFMFLKFCSTSNDVFFFLTSKLYDFEKSLWMKKEGGAGGPILDADPALGTPQARTEEEPWGTEVLHCHHKFSLTGRGKKRGNISPQILLPQNPLPQITQREHQDLCNTGKHTWPSNRGVQRLDLVRPCILRQAQREQQAVASQWHGSPQLAGRAASPGRELLCRPQVQGLGHWPQQQQPRQCSEILELSKSSYTVTARARGAQGMEASQPGCWWTALPCTLPQPPRQQSYSYQHEHLALGPAGPSQGGTQQPNAPSTRKGCTALRKWKRKAKHFFSLWGLLVVHFIINSSEDC